MMTAILTVNLVVGMTFCTIHPLFARKQAQTGIAVSSMESLAFLASLAWLTFTQLWLVMSVPQVRDC